MSLEKTKYFEAKALEILKHFNVKKELYNVVKQVVIEKSLEYSFKVVGEDMQVLCKEGERLQIGQVSRGNFS